MAPSAVPTVTPGLSRWRRLVQQRLDDWPTRHAFVPRDTCVLILNTCSWGICCYMLVTISVQITHYLTTGLATWMFFVAPPFLILQLLSAYFRGLPFTVRFGVLMLNLAKAFVFGLMGWHINTGMIIGGQAMAILTLIFYGPRAAYPVLGMLGAVYALIAWFWAQGLLPIVPGISHEQWREFYNAFHPRIWIGTGIGVMTLFLMSTFLFQYILRHVQASNAATIRALENLAREQEHRARAEEARLHSELALRETQKFDALGRLASGVAHDVNNALTVVKCWAKLLAEEPHDRETKEALGLISSATESASQITSHLLAFSRNDPQKKAVADLSALLRNEIKTLTRLLPQDIVIKADLQPMMPVRLGDGQLQEMVLNLALNARDAMPRGGRLTIRLRDEERGFDKTLSPGRYVKLEITDTGTGMDAATQARIFEPFYTTKGPSKGTGLGLAMVFGLVSKASGRVEVHSAPGAGSTFTVFLPKADPAELDAIPAPVRISASRRCSVLVAEDHTEVRRVIEQILVQDGFTVVATADGDAATAQLLLPKASFGLLIIDGIMPGRPSHEVIATALRINPECRVIICSAYMRDELLQRGIEDGVYHRLAKPFGPDNLRTMLNQALAS